jgi:hypothetical protein
MRKILWLLLIKFILVWMMVHPATAVVTGAATLTTGNSTTLHGTGCSTTVCWFEYGGSSGTYYPWRSYNATAAGGVFSTEIAGLPLIGGMTVYYRAVDPNGNRGAEATVAILAVTISPEPTFGQHIQNVTKYRYAPRVLAAEIGGPFFDVTPIMVFSGLMFFFLYGGIWISGKSTFYPTLLFGMTSFLIFAISPGLPPEFSDFAMGILIASFAGVVFWFLKR